MIKLTVTCDDGGLSRGINKSIEELYLEKYVTTTSVFMNANYLVEIFDTISRYSIGHGIHLNLTSGQSLTRPNLNTGLVNQAGSFKGIKNLLLMTLIPNAILVNAIKAELIEQMEKYIRLAPKPQHITTHMHFHMIPSLKSIVQDLCQQYDINWMRTPDLRRSVIPFNILRKVLPANPQFDGNQVRTLDYVIDLNFWRRLRQPHDLVRAILTLQGHVELVVHPSEEYDITYPIDLTNPPHKRYLQVVYLKYVVNILKQYDSQVKFCDPAVGC